MPDAALIDLLASGGYITLLAVIIFGAVKEKQWWVPGPSCRQALTEERERTAKMEADRDRWQNATLRLLDTTEALAEKP